MLSIKIYLLIGVAWGTASKCVLFGTGAKDEGFATFGFENPDPPAESFRVDVVIPLYFSSFPYNNSWTSLAINRLKREKGHL